MSDKQDIKVYELRYESECHGCNAVVKAGELANRFRRTTYCLTCSEAKADERGVKIIDTTGQAPSNGRATTTGERAAKRAERAAVPANGSGSPVVTLEVLRETLAEFATRLNQRFMPVDISQLEQQLVARGSLFKAFANTKPPVRSKSGAPTGSEACTATKKDGASCTLRVTADSDVCPSHLRQRDKANGTADKPERKAATATVAAALDVLPV